MDIDNKDPKGWGTLLHVIKRAPKAWVSFLKEPMEFAFNPLNHLIAIGPKLDGKIFVRDRAPGPLFYRMLGQTHMNGWSRVIASQNWGSIDYIFPLD